MQTVRLQTRTKRTGRKMQTGLREERKRKMRHPPGRAQEVPKRVKRVPRRALLPLRKSRRAAWTRTAAIHPRRMLRCIFICTGNCRRISLPRKKPKPSAGKADPWSLMHPESASAATDSEIMRGSCQRSRDGPIMNVTLIRSERRREGRNESFIHRTDRSTTQTITTSLLNFYMGRSRMFAAAAVFRKRCKPVSV